MFFKIAMESVLIGRGFVLATRTAYNESAYISKNNFAKGKKNRTYRKRFYYTLITTMLLICLFQSIRGACLNIAKCLTLNGQFNKLEVIKSMATRKNEELKSQLKNYKTSHGVEALARDTLNMVGKDEVLVIIKEPYKKSAGE